MAKGDETAFLVLYQQHQPAVYRYACRMTGSRETADDVVQEVFMALIRGARGFDPSVGPLRSYLYGIARRKLIRETPPEGLQPLEGIETPVEAESHVRLEEAEALELMRQALAALPEHYREAVVLCDLEEMDYTEAAEILGCAVGTIRSRVHRARALLAERLTRLRVQTG